MAFVYGDVTSGRSVHGPKTFVASWRMPPSAQESTTAFVPPARTMFNVGRRTITRKLQLLVLPQASVATTRTVLVVSRLKLAPDGGDDVTVTELQASVADNDHMMGVLVLQVRKMILVGQIIVGLLVSISVTICVHTEAPVMQPFVQLASTG